MAMAVTKAPLFSPSTPISARRYSARARASKTTTLIKKGRVVGNLGHLGEVVRKDMDFLKKGIRRGLEWGNEALQVRRVSKTLDDLLWLRHLEEPQAPPLQPRPWPQPCYPGQASTSLSLFQVMVIFPSSIDLLKLKLMFIANLLCFSCIFIAWNFPELHAKD